MTQLHHIAPACVSRGIGLTHLLSVDALGLCYLTQLPHARSTLLGETPSTRGDRAVAGLLVRLDIGR